MARTVTILEVMTRARERFDGVGDTDFMSDAELQKLVDAAYTELVDILVRAEIHQFETTTTITSTGVTNYSLPADHYKTLAIDYRYATDRYVEVPLLTFAERNRESSRYFNQYGTAEVGYRVVGSEIVFSPAPATGQVFRHIYVPAPAKISAVATSTTIDGIAGWDELLVIMVAISVRIKEEIDCRDLKEQRDAMLARIYQMGVDRSPSQRVVDTREDYGDGWSYTGRRRY
jgi:hypothetical protein